MAGTVVKTTTRVTGEVTKHSLAWTSDAAGVVSGNSVKLGLGSIIAVAFKPGAGGVQPTDLYDVSMTCDDHPAVNILDDGSGSASLGANLSNVNATEKAPMIGAANSGVRRWLHGGGYTLGVTNAGNAKSGTVDIYVSSRTL